MFDIAYRFPGIYFFFCLQTAVFFYAWFLLSQGFKARVYLSTDENRPRRKKEHVGKDSEMNP